MFLFAGSVIKIQFVNTFSNYINFHYFQHKPALSPSGLDGVGRAVFATPTNGGDTGCVAALGSLSEGQARP